MAKAKFDIKSEAQRGLHAYVGVADLALETVKGYVADVRELAQKRLMTAQQHVRAIELQPQVLRKQASSVVTSRVDELSKEAKARRTAVEKRVADLQAEAAGTYADLAKRGESVVKKFQGKPATREAVANAKTTAAKAKATRSQTASTAAGTKRAAQKSAAKSSAPSSAKATGTAAKKTAASATKAVSS